jgi:hypothetical protein
VNFVRPVASEIQLFKNWVFFQKVTFFLFMFLILLNIITNTPYYFFYSNLTNEIAAGVDEFVLSNEIANITSKIELLTKIKHPRFCC